MTPAPVCYAVPSERTSPLWCRAFAQGSGGTVTPIPDLQPGPVALFGSAALWPLLQEAQRAGRPWFYGDHCYLGPVFQRFRITRNGYQLGAWDGEPAWTKLAALHVRPKRWQTGGRHVLVCLQGDRQYELFGMTKAGWLAQVVATLTERTDRPIRIRSRHDPRDLAADLTQAWAVVTWSSNAAVQALIAGVPVFVTAPWAAAAALAAPGGLAWIEKPYYPPDRETFLARLAGAQWTLDEMTRGEAWAVLRESGGLRHTGGSSRGEEPAKAEARP